MTLFGFLHEDATMALSDCAVAWDTPASLKDVKTPTSGFAWVGDPVYDGTIAGAIRKFRTLPPEQQRRVEMLTDPGAIAGLQATIIGHDALAELASRSDVPSQ
jgi:hypothetical protein